jgi:hypothetical protein
VVRRVSLQAIAAGGPPINDSDLLRAIRQELEKEGTVPIRKVVRSGCLNCAPLCSLHQFEP